MEHRIATFKILFHHADTRISACARATVKEAKKWMSDVRQRERREDEVREQRFEKSNRFVYQ
ncbi:MAG: hypothetical protein OXC26_01160 [Albidovulum sp.]|nr:hypothetical protein [Albidovulum sp.]